MEYKVALSLDIDVLDYVVQYMEEMAPEELLNYTSLESEELYILAVNILNVWCYDNALTGLNVEDLLDNCDALKGDLYTAIVDYANERVSETRLDHEKYLELMELIEDILPAEAFKDFYHRVETFGEITDIYTLASALEEGFGEI